MNKETIHSKPHCIIPARGGSKRIPRKNIIDFNGKPMIAWAIEAAIACGVFGEVVVSTDDAEIAGIARAHGASTPFMRKPELADDFATTAEVLEDALSRLPVTGYACCLYPTAPMITGDDLKSAMAMLIDNGCDSVIATCEFDFHPLRGFEVGEDGSLAFKWPQYATTRSQDLPEMIHDAGAFYCVSMASFATHKSLVMPKTLPYQLERLRSVDIDSLDDLEIAKALHLKAATSKNAPNN